jgi:hypothetical protein
LCVPGSHQHQGAEERVSVEQTQLRGRETAGRGRGGRRDGSYAHDGRGRRRSVAGRCRCSYHAPKVSRAQGRAGGRASVPWSEAGQEQRVSCCVVSCRTVAVVVVVGWVEAGPFDGGRLLDREREWVASGGPKRQALARCSLLADLLVVYMPLSQERRRGNGECFSRTRQRAVAVWQQYPARAPPAACSTVSPTARQHRGSPSATLERMLCKTIRRPRPPRDLDRPRDRHCPSLNAQKPPPAALEAFSLSCSTDAGPE